LILRIALSCLVSTAASATLIGGAHARAVEAQTVNAIPESAAGLQSQLEAILEAVKKHDSKQFEDLIDGLEVPENADWFTTTFGEELGSKLASTYKASWSTYEDQVGSMFQSTGTVKKIRVFVKEFSSSSPASATISCGRYC
jgi:hypothetical protein